MTKPADILLIEDTPSLSLVYQDYLESAGLAVEIVANGASALQALERNRYRLVLLDLKLPDMDGFDVLRNAEGVLGSTEVIVITAYGSINSAVDAMRLGAIDFIMKPFSKERLLTTVRNAMERAHLVETVEDLQADFGRKRFFGFIGQSPVMQGVYRAIDSVARSKASVFITGESGTGKEVCAEAIHKAGPRSDKPFVPLNCGAIPKDLIESELFGHVKGAFSGATANRDGAATAADGGTLFLDEIGEMDINLQVKLLRFLQTGKVQKVGSSDLKPVDVRVIAATNRDPLAEVEAGGLREDLYYRLHVIPIVMPPLRERDGDVLEIAQVFLDRFAKEEGKGFRRFSPGAEDILVRHAWPGNVRELLNVVRNTVVMNDGEEVTAEMLPSLVRPRTGALSEQVPLPRPALSVRQVSPVVTGDPGTDYPTVQLGRSLQAIERDVIEYTIRANGGSIPKAARVLEVSPSTIYRKREAWAADGDDAG